MGQVNMFEQQEEDGHRENLLGLQLAQFRELTAVAGNSDTVFSLRNYIGIEEEIDDHDEIQSQKQPSAIQNRGDHIVRPSQSAPEASRADIDLQVSSLQLIL